MLLLKILGYGYQYSFYDANHYLTEALINYPTKDLNSLLLETDAFSSFKLRQNNNEVKRLEDIEPSKTGFWYGMDFITRLEITPKGEKRIKLKFYDLRTEEMLFQTYNTSVVQIPENGILIIEKLIGNFGKLKIDAARLNLNDLKFEIAKISFYKEHVITTILHHNIKLRMTGEDLVSVSKSVFWV